MKTTTDTSKQRDKLFLVERHEYFVITRYNTSEANLVMRTKDFHFAQRIVNTYNREMGF